MAQDLSVGYGFAESCWCDAGVSEGFFDDGVEVGDVCFENLVHGWNALLGDGFWVTFSDGLSKTRLDALIFC